MATWKSATASAAAIGIYMAGTPAFADVTAQQVWEDWKTYMVGFGYKIDGTESTSGNALTVSDLTMSMTLPEDEGTMKLTMGQFTFADNADGTVSVMIPPQLPVTVNIRPTVGESVDAAVDYNTSGYSVIVSGDPDDMTYNYSVADLTLALAELVVDGTPRDIGTATLTIKDITGTSNMKSGDLRTNTQRVNTGPIEMAIDFTDPEGSDARIVMNGAYNSIGFVGGGTFPKGMDANDLPAMLAAGFAFDGEFTAGGGATDFNVAENGGNVQGVIGSDGGTLKIAMNQDKLQYAGAFNNAKLNIAGGDVPIPIHLAMAKYGFNLLMPLTKGKAEQDFAFALTLGNFTMSDLLWSIFDPAATLPRDPATVAIDLTGKAKLLVDILDPKQMGAVERGETLAGELNALGLNSLLVSAAGAELTGDGAFTFDNTDMVTFDGIPAPTGAIDLKLVGGNGLLDKLIAMGLVPEDQAMGMRMMMGLFAVPGADEDTLTSRIEVSGDGQIKANGQRIR